MPKEPKVALSDAVQTARRTMEEHAEGRILRAFSMHLADQPSAPLVIELNALAMDHGFEFHLVASVWLGGGDKPPEYQYTPVWFFNRKER
jgi:hypothetical protein